MRNSFNGYVVLVVVGALAFVGLITWAITSSVQVNNNLEANVNVGVTCTVDKLTNRKPHKQSRRYYAETSDCGKLKTNRNEWKELQEGATYTVTIKGDKTVQQVGENWQKVG